MYGRVPGTVPYKHGNVTYLLVPYRTVSYGTEVPRFNGIFWVCLYLPYGIDTVPYLTHLIIVSFRTFLPFSLFITSPRILILFPPLRDINNV